MCVSRARHQVQHGDWLVELQYPPGVTRDWVDDQAVDLFHQVMNDVMPYASGRDWREQIGTNRHLYDIFLCWCAESGVEPMSLSFFQTNGKSPYSTLPH